MAPKPKQKDLQGKIAVVTGANSGIGLEACVQLAERGCEIVMCCRNEKKAEEAQREIAKRSGQDLLKIQVAQLDLSDLDNIGTFRSRYDVLPGISGKPVDMLILNAGVMAIPHREATKQGLEMQMGTNVVGHFKFAAEMIDLVKKAPNGRVVAVSSLMHKFARGIDFADFNREKHYSKWPVYCETKLGDLLLIGKLNRLLVEKKVDNVVAVSCHPGYSSTNLQQHTFGATFANALFAQSAHMGATPTVLAATDPNAKRDDYAGPTWFDVWGKAKWNCAKTKYASDKEIQDKLWMKCEEITKVDFASKL